MDISFPSTPSMGGKKCWLLVVEDSIDYAWNYFPKENSEVKDVMISLLKYLKAIYGITVRYICCDDDRENEVFQQLCKQEGIGVKFN